MTGHAGDFTLLTADAPKPKPAMFLVSWDDPDRGRATTHVSNAWVERTRERQLRLLLVTNVTYLRNGSTVLNLRTGALTPTGVTPTPFDASAPTAEDDVLNAALTFERTSELLSDFRASHPSYALGDVVDALPHLVALDLAARATAIALLTAGWTGTQSDLVRAATAATS